MVMMQVLGAVAGHVIKKAVNKAAENQQNKVANDQNQSQYPTQGQYPPQGQYSPQGQFPPQGWMPPNGYHQTTFPQSPGAWQGGAPTPYQGHIPTDGYWGNLIGPDKGPSDMYKRLLDAIFNYANQSVHPQNSNGLEPNKSSWLFDELGALKEDNTAKMSSSIGIGNALANPEAGANEILTMYYTAMSFPFTTTHDRAPVLTREGFYALMVLDTHISPPAQLVRLNKILSTRHSYLLDPMTNQPFARNQIPRESLPANPDPQILQQSRACKANFATQMKAYLGNPADPIQMSGQIVGMQPAPRDYGQLMQMQNFMHHQTMSALTPGYWTQGSGGWNFHDTGGMRW